MLSRICFVPLLALSLGGCSVATPPPKTFAPPADARLRAIDEDYVASVKPLFERSCASCHGAGHALPWYHALPLVRGIIDDDVARARRTMDIAQDFPFRGRGTPAEYLDAINDVLDEGSMPPLRYRALHWRAGLDGDEKNAMREWVERSRQRLHE